MGVPQIAAFGARIAIVSSLLLGTTGCRTSVEVTPDVGTPDEIVPIQGRVEYSGGVDFLPRSLRATDAPDAPVLRYDYATEYDHTSNWQIVNPLILFGYPGIGVDVQASGTLEIVPNSGSARRIQERCVVEMRRAVWIWGAPSSSDLRREALLCVRDRIDRRLGE